MMTKKEKQEYQALQTKLRVAAAFHRTCPVEPDVPIPDVYGKVAVGYLPIACSSPRVERAWSRSVAHGTGPYAVGTIGSQGGVELYSTRTLALRALRYEMEEELATTLAGIDKQIEEEEALNDTRPSP